MGSLAAYDGIADWYATQFLPRQAGDPLHIERNLRRLLGAGRGVCLEVGCGTGAYARPVREMGWTPIGVDLSAAMLRYVDGRLSVARADAARLPVRTGRVSAVIAVMVHTDMPGYPAVLGEVSRVLAAGGMFVHIGVHPCFSGGFANRTDPEAVVIRPGYLNTYWTRDSYTDQGIRDKVGAMHRPMSQLLNLVLDAGLVLERFAEGGEPTPIMFALRARKPA
jgi:ubiquinone/menaquinone biosynthesis C-methylase UbiE